RSGGRGADRGTREESGFARRGAGRARRPDRAPGPSRLPTRQRILGPADARRERQEPPRPPNGELGRRLHLEGGELRGGHPLPLRPLGAGQPPPRHLKTKRPPAEGGRPEGRPVTPAQKARPAPNRKPFIPLVSPTMFQTGKE